MLSRESYDEARLLIAASTLEYGLSDEVTRLRSPHRSLMSHNERLLTDLVVRATAALALRSCAGTYERATKVMEALMLHDDPISGE